MRSGRFSALHQTKSVILDFQANSLRRDESLRKFGIEQKRRKFFAAETRRRIAASQVFGDSFGESLPKFYCPSDRPISVVDQFEMINVHHQNAKRTSFRFRLRGFTPQFREKRTTRQ